MDGKGFMYDEVAQWLHSAGSQQQKHKRCAQRMRSSTPYLVLFNTFVSTACLLAIAWSAAAQTPQVQTHVAAPEGGQVKVYNTVGTCVDLKNKN